MADYRDGLTPEQIASLYTPNQNVVRIRARLAALRAVNPGATMADALGDLATERSGRRVKYADGALVDVRP